MQVLTSRLHFLVNRNAELAVPLLFWPVNCIKIGGHVAPLSCPSIYFLFYDMSNPNITLTLTANCIIVIYSNTFRLLIYRESACGYASWALPSAFIHCFYENLARSLLYRFIAQVIIKYMHLKSKLCFIMVYLPFFLRDMGWFFCQATTIKSLLSVFSRLIF